MNIAWLELLGSSHATFPQHIHQLEIQFARVDTLLYFGDPRLINIETLKLSYVAIDGTVLDPALAFVGTLTKLEFEKRHVFYPAALYVAV